LHVICGVGVDYGRGFGREVSLRLADRGHEVIAAVHHPWQVGQMTGEASARGVSLRVEKLDLLDEDDREAACGWDIDVLVNNAAVGEGDPIVEMPLELVREVFEVNVFATLACHRHPLTLALDVQGLPPSLSASPHQEVPSAGSLSSFRDSTPTCEMTAIGNHSE
jgi:NAD(P)-dependent dehydrogenase (short-subunit alcohol dehydrogenase family)